MVMFNFMEDKDFNKCHICYRMLFYESNNQSQKIKNIHDVNIMNILYFL